jgi:hypothetical protein
MIDRTKKAVRDGKKPQDCMNAEKTAKPAEAPAFTLYGKGGRAWVERNWSASSLAFNFSTDQTRRT